MSGNLTDKLERVADIILDIKLMRALIQQVQNYSADDLKRLTNINTEMEVTSTGVYITTRLYVPKVNIGGGERLANTVNLGDGVRSYMNAKIGEILVYAAEAAQKDLRGHIEKESLLHVGTELNHTMGELMIGNNLK